MSSRTIHIFTDRDGDQLLVTPRDLSEGGNPIPDPIISVVRNKNSQSIVMNDEELESVMKSLGDAFGYTVYKTTKRRRMSY